METYKLRNHNGDVHDTKIPVELARYFNAMTEWLSDVSQEKYHCTPFIMTEDESGITTPIVEVKDDGTHVKTPFHLTIKTA